eukprot:118133-Pyramimonas_sp.AAC.1
MEAEWAGGDEAARPMTKSYKRHDQEAEGSRLQQIPCKPNSRRKPKHVHKRAAPHPHHEPKTPTPQTASLHTPTAN